jgi:hypothetical protein
VAQMIILSATSWLIALSSCLFFAWFLHYWLNIKWQLIVFLLILINLAGKILAVVSEDFPLLAAIMTGVSGIVVGFGFTFW